MISAPTHIAIAAKKAAMLQIPIQRMWGIASSRRKKTVSRERCRSSERTRRIGWSLTAGSMAVTADD